MLSEVEFDWEPKPRRKALWSLNNPYNWPIAAVLIFGLDEIIAIAYHNLRYPDNTLEDLQARTFLAQGSSYAPSWASTHRIDRRSKEGEDEAVPSLS